jgi:hypothetical protein
MSGFHIYFYSRGVGFCQYYYTKNTVKISHM